MTHTADVSKRIAELSPDQLKLLAHRLATTRDPAVLRAAVRESPLFPLSFTQERLFYTQQLRATGAAYHITAAVRLCTRVDSAVVERCLNELTARHEILHTSFPLQDGRPVQRIDPIRPQTLEVRALTQHEAGERLRAALEIVTEYSRQPYDLENGPLVRWLLLRLDERDHVMVFNVHHIIFDGWSSHVLSREFVALYDAFIHGRPSPLPPLPVQFADCAAWERERLQGDELEQLLSFWEQELDGLTSLDLPTDRSRPPSLTSDGSSESFALSSDLARRIHDLTKQSGVSAFATHLAVFTILLHRYTGVEDVAVGVPVANRKKVELEGVVGPFVNGVVIRAGISGNLSFRQVLERVWRSSLRALEHQEVPVEQLIRRLNPTRDLSRHPFTQVGFQFEDRPSLGVQADDHRKMSMPLEVPVTAAVSDLQWCVREESAMPRAGAEPDRERGSSISVIYNTNLFDRSTVRRMIEHYVTLVDHVTRNPDAPVSELPLVTGAEKRQVLVEWSRASEVPRPDRTIQELFASQVARTPDAVAATSVGEQVTYRELNRRANRVAASLRRLGAGPGVLVGLCLEPSLDMLAGLLGIWKSGAAYVALDLEIPAERLSYLIADSGLDMIVGRDTATEKLSEFAGVMVSVSRDQPSPKDRDDEPRSGSRPSDAAYVIYTSGTTGSPKGVVVTHQGVANLASWGRETFGLGPGHRALQFAAMSFDASVWEITSALCSGATLVVPPRTSRLPGDTLLDLLDEEAVSLATLPPSSLAVTRPRALSALGTLIVAGDVCSAEIVKAWAPGRRLFNAYGPTESSVCATNGECAAAGKPHIGRPIPNVHVYVLDRYFEPVPVGVTGELYVGGPGVARGYLNRLDLTAERFIPDPFGEDGTRMYRTGDLVRWLPDGNIDFLGRADHQVKVRGHRVELGEIDAILSGCTGVNQSVTVKREDAPGVERLVAYVVADVELSEGDMRKFLMQRLPDYMIPTFFVRLERLPMTATGKVDRLSLPVPERQLTTDASFAGPQGSDVERVVTDTWREILAVGQVGVDENFFDVGGNSLLLVRVHERLQDRLARSISINDLFNHPTIALLCEHLSGGRAHDDLANEGFARAESRKAAAEEREQRRRRAETSAGDEWGSDEIHAEHA